MAWPLQASIGAPSLRVEFNPNDDLCYCPKLRALVMFSRGILGLTSDAPASHPPVGPH
jgi:hypothetical protein